MTPADPNGAVGRGASFARPVSFYATGRVPAGIDALFALLTDPARMPEWLPGCDAAVSDGPIGQGVHIRARFGSRVTEFDVVDHVPPHRFGWAERGQRKGWRLWFRLNPADSGTAVTIGEVWAPASLTAWVWGQLIRRRQPQRHIEEILARLQRAFT
ncbi:MAG TPA: SRPBCC family protein [Gemmatimonadales bacterium]|jgi:uncharacterized protein YndB with AHSA1/START domain|nr:SRPBCC family protein [Gemmatimonadales bacterium]